MRVVALYDIHGNIDALEAVLADPRVVDADAIVVGGDAVPGRFANAVLDRLEALDVPVTWVRGNGEREVVEALDFTELPDVDDLAAHTAALSAAELGEERARSLAGLPTSVVLDGVRYCHASPRRDDEMLTKATPTERWASALVNVEEPVVVVGHTHQQSFRVIGEIRVVNAGSVGLPYEGELDVACWLEVDAGTPTLRRTSYDSAAAGRRMLDAGWPDPRSIDAALVDPVEPGEITAFFEGLVEPDPA